jgi:hypothetical protein
MLYLCPYAEELTLLNNGNYYPQKLFSLAISPNYENTLDKIAVQKEAANFIVGRLEMKS